MFAHRGHPVAFLRITFTGQMEKQAIQELRAMTSSYSIVAIAEDVVWADIGDEVAILNTRTGKYYSLDEVGASVWKRLQEPRHVSEIRDSILEEYEVEPDRWERDLVALLQQLEGEGLIEIEDESDS